MEQTAIVYTIFLIFGGAAFLATLALFFRQSILVSYIVLGFFMGPFGFHLINNVGIMREVGSVGIVFLLFLLGLYLRPQSLLHLLHKTVGVALFTSAVFALIGFGFAVSFGFNLLESVVIGVTMMFSSTIIGLKLLPKMVLQHRHVGEVMISILLLQDLIAIFVVFILNLSATARGNGWTVLWIIFSFPLLLILAYFAQRYVVIPLMERFSAVREYIFLISVAWCVGVASLASWMGLSAGIGAFIAGVAIAVNPISEFIAENLKPLRDFFLVIFFFCLGVEFNFNSLSSIVFPAVMLSLVLLLCKPLIFKVSLRRVHEIRHIASEAAVRLGQASEFSLLIAYIAERTQVIGHLASSLIQATTLITFIISSYVIMLCYPNHEN